MKRLACLCCAAGALFATSSYAIDADRDFSGAWVLVPEQSRVAGLGIASESQLTVTQDDAALRCSAVLSGASAVWTYNLGGGESQYRIGPESRNSVVKWEGAALLVNTLVSGPQNYTLMDRWHLSPDRRELTIRRQVVRARGEGEGTLLYRHAGWSRARPEVRANAAVAVLPPAADQQPPAPSLTPRTEPQTAPDVLTVKAGTHVLLSLLNSLNTKKSRAGDRVYLRTAVPVAVSDRIVIPRGSDVAGTLVESPPAAKGKKGALYIRFDSLTLPNGVTRDLLSRPDGSNEGMLTSAGDTSGDVRRTAEGAGIGTSVGGIAGAAAGHAGLGLGIGGLAGAAAGLGGIFSKKPEPVLPRGTTLEMVLDRDLAFHGSDLP